MNTTTDMTLGTKLTYALPAFALAIVGIPVYVYIPKFYTDVVGVDVAVVGALLLSVRLFDAVTDPAIGWWSDRSRTQWGRRRPFIVVGSLLLAIAILALFMPPATAGTAMNAIWFAFWVYALFFFWTLVTVPYESLGPELTRDYDQRTSLFAVRDGFLIAGTLAAAAAPTLISGLWGLSDSSADTRKSFAIMAGLYAPLLVLASGWCVFRIRERGAAADPTRLGLWQRVHIVRQNKPFLILLAAFTISAIGSNLPAALILYYVQYVLGSAQADLFLLLYFVTGIAFLPMWIRVAGKIGKKNAWLGSMLINTTAFLGVFFLGPGDALWYGILVTASGIGFGATLALPSALQADVIDYDELISGRRQEGHYVGMWSVAKKLAAAVGVGVGLGALGLAGYAPNTDQSETVKWVIRCFYALVPSICNLAAVAIAVLYPLSGEMHRRVIDAIDQVKAGRTVADPLNPGVMRCGQPAACRP